MANTIIDLTGKKFGEWTVLKQSNKKSKHGIYWTCQCSCGLIKDICGTDLRQGKTTKCKNHKSNLQRNNPIDIKYKPYVRTNNHQGKIKNEIGNKYGLLTVIQQDSIDPINRYVNWLCQCECGNYRIVPGYKLRNETITHCGCQPNSMSNGELKIYNLLKENNINFKREYSFSDLLGKNGGRLRFDFGILNNKNELLYLIEYDGIQHYQPNCFGQNDQLFKITQQHDKIKNQYCNKHNIPLIRIPYTKLNHITINDLII